MKKHAAMLLALTLLLPSCTASDTVDEPKKAKNAPGFVRLNWCRTPLVKCT